VPYSNVSTKSDMKSGFLLPFLAPKKYQVVNLSVNKYVGLKRNTILRGGN